MYILLTYENCQNTKVGARLVEVAGLGPAISTKRKTRRKRRVFLSLIDNCVDKYIIVL
jgi:hypothetical protein